MLRSTLVPVLVASAIVCAFHAAPVRAQTPRAVIVDTDAGADDLMAIAYLLSRSDVHIEAVTVTYGLAHTAAGATNVLRLLQLAGRRDVPVYLGRDTPRGVHHEFPSAWRTASDELIGVRLPPAVRAPEQMSAAVFLADRLSDAARPVDVLSLGALTNLAAACRGPRPLAAVRSLVIMGGAVRVAGNLNAPGLPHRNTTAEWNIFADPGAARRVLGSGLPIQLIPLDATSRVPIDRAFVAEVVADAKTPLGRAVAEILGGVHDLIDEGDYFAWDPLAAVALTNPSVIQLERMAVEVHTGLRDAGRTVPGAAGPAIDVAVSADPAQFRQLFLGALARR